ncbi:MAG: PAS domain S-box protein [Bryobacteraceae bacterium]
MKKVKVVLPLKTTIQATRLLAAMTALFALWSLFCFGEMMLRVNGDGHRIEPTGPGELAGERRQVAVRWGVSLLLAAGCIGALAQSERKREAARPSWSRVAMESAADAIFVTDKDLRILEWNAAVERLLGYPREEVRGQGLECILPITPEMRLAALRIPDSEARLRARVMRRDGSRIALEITLRQQWLGDRTGFVCFAGSAPAASPVEPAYREEIRFLTEIFDATPAPMLVLDPHGRIERMNASAQELFGRSAIELRATPYWEAFLTSETEAEKARSEFEEIDRSPLDPVVETWTLANRDSAALSWTRSAIRGGDGAVRHIVLASPGPAPEKRPPTQAAIVSETDTTAAVSERSI